MVRMSVNLAGLFALSVCTAAAGGADGPWWPVQALPRGIVRTVPWQSFDAPGTAYQMMVQSVAGLAAQAVNEQRGDVAYISALILWRGAPNGVPGAEV